MKNVVSRKKLAANRKNAAKSTGPKSQLGKTSSSKNALTHGLLARESVILDGDGAENIQDFEFLLEQLTKDFQPQGAVEQMLVERITACLWRLRRAHRFEVGALRWRLDDSRYAPDAPPSVETADSIAANIARAKDHLARQVANLEWAKEQDDLTTRESYERLYNTWCEVESQLDVVLIQNEKLRDWPERFKAALQREGLVGEKLRDKACQTLRDGCVETPAQIEKLEEELESATRYDRLRRERAALVSAIPGERDLDKLVRYETMIDREFHRSLMALERIQRARRGDHVPAPIAMDVNVTGLKEAG